MKLPLIVSSPKKLAGLALIAASLAVAPNANAIQLGCFSADYGGQTCSCCYWLTPLGWAQATDVTWS